MCAAVCPVEMPYCVGLNTQNPYLPYLTYLLNFLILYGCLPAAAPSLPWVRWTPSAPAPHPHIVDV
jgi:hypothetical protein